MASKERHLSCLSTSVDTFQDNEGASFRTTDHGVVGTSVFFVSQAKKLLSAFCCFSALCNWELIIGTTRCFFLYDVSMVPVPYVVFVIGSTVWYHSTKHQVRYVRGSTRGQGLHINIEHRNK
jgi:hypothetical protein